MFRRIKRSRSMRDGLGNVGHDLAHGPDAPSPNNQGPVSGSPGLADWDDGVPQNANPSPVTFPDGRNPYLDRPLPPPPPSKISDPSSFVSMQPRPSTSGGPNAKASALLGLSTLPIADKRMSKDDMFLGGGHLNQKRAWQPFRIAGRGGLPTPESSPGRSPPMVDPASLPTRMPTPESSSSGEIQIGMALGSPNHLPDSYSGWEPQKLRGEGAEGSRGSNPPDSAPGSSSSTVQRQKTQRRKFFGGLFGGKRNTDLAKATEGSEVGRTVVTVTTTHDSHYLLGQSTPVRSPGGAERKIPKYRPLIVQPPAEPIAESPVQRARPMFTGMGMSSRQEVRQVAHGSSQLSSSGAARPSPDSGSGPFLDVEIPSIKLERYSVMFGSLLNAQDSTSLLARRQATLEKLRTINDQIAREEEEERIRFIQRRATSPQPAKSPALSLFPPPTVGRQGTSPSTPRKLSPLIRSNTSPALLPSPSQPTFENRDHLRREKKTVTIVSPRVEGFKSQPAVALSRDNELPNAPTQDGLRFRPEESSLILDSPQSLTDEDVGKAVAEDDYHHILKETASPSSSTVTTAPAIGATKAAYAEPQWQMISPPVSSASSVTTATTRRPPSSSASSVQTHITRPSVDIDESDSALKQAIEISIARQISISRQQRTLLRPVKTNINTAGPLPAHPQSVKTSPGGNIGASPIRKGALGLSERVAETRFATPMLVVPREPRNGQWAQHRKSERVVLEGA
ncbi:hypothetical protein VTK73DRAFT_4904 [Phialemonium thermophilum]|uniref:Uncharacterized protein n=1 Tax=Phialemonium thermophilum TaxID=223376 RepID=A0ABR3WRS5_9PEZI